jgi:hypothetical protein
MAPFGSVPVTATREEAGTGLDPGAVVIGSHRESSGVIGSHW